jgi:ribonuclease T2
MSAFNCTTWADCQFWNTYTGLEKNGSFLPNGSWGIHGLWPDRCDGTYGQYCDLARQ